MRYYITRKDNLRRKLFYKNEYVKKLLRFMQQNVKVDFSKRFIINHKITKFSPNTSISRLKNFCILTGRSRSVYRDFRLTRMQFRSLASFGLLTGIRKSSW